MSNLKKTILKFAAAMFAVALLCAIVPAKEANAATTQIVTITSSTGVNMRKVANTNGTRIATLPLGAKATFKGWAGDNSGNTWILVTYNGTTGYIMYKTSWENITYSTTTTTTTTDSFTNLASNGYIVTSQVNGLRVHQSANTTSSTIGYLSSGHQVTATGYNSSWFRIMFYDDNGDYVTGYVWRAYATLIKRNSLPTETFTATTGTVTVNVNGLYVHSNATIATTNRIGTAKLNASYTVTGVSNNWYRIKYGSRIGYVVRNYVTYYTKTETTTVKLNNTDMALVIDDDPDDAVDTVKVLKWTSTKKKLKMKTCKWTSSDKTVVTVKKNTNKKSTTVTAQSEGTAKVYFKYKVTGSSKWYKVSCTVTVTEDATYDDDLE